LFTDTLEHFLDSCGVANKGGGHLETLWWDVANRCLDVVRDPLDEIGRVLILYVKHLLINLLGGHASTELARSCEVSSVTRVCGAHHVLGVEALGSELRDSEGAVLLGATRCEWCKTNHEKVKTRERNKVNGELSEVAVELTRESERACYARHASRDKVVQVSIGGGGKLEGTEANVIKSLIVQNHDLVCILNKL